MPEFVQLRPDIYRLQVPFGPSWTGVLLVRGPENVLIDSAAKASDVDGFLLPALQKLGLSLEQIDWLACTHCHGDHVGGHARIRALRPAIRVACFEGSAEKLADPLKFSRLIRAAFPRHSPEAPADLRGIAADRLLKDGETLTPCLRLIATPGHDSDAVCWLDTRDRTLITGDSLQLNGTVSQGAALVMDLAGYRDSLRTLAALPVEHILAGHDYLPLGDRADGAEAVKAYLDACGAYIAQYEAFLSERWAAGERDPADLAVRLIRRFGGTVPEYLFLPLFTVTQILNHFDQEEVSE